MPWPRSSGKANPSATAALGQQCCLRPGPQQTPLLAGVGPGWNTVGIDMLGLVPDQRRRYVDRKNAPEQVDPKNGPENVDPKKGPKKWTVKNSPEKWTENTGPKKWTEKTAPNRGPKRRPRGGPENGQRRKIQGPKNGPNKFTHVYYRHKKTGPFSGPCLGRVFGPGSKRLFGPRPGPHFSSESPARLFGPLFWGRFSGSSSGQIAMYRPRRGPFSATTNRSIDDHSNWTLVECMLHRIIP